MIIIDTQTHRKIFAFGCQLFTQFLQLFFLQGEAEVKSPKFGAMADYSEPPEFQRLVNRVPKSDPGVGCELHKHSLHFVICANLIPQPDPIVFLIF